MCCFTRDGGQSIFFLTFITCLTYLNFLHPSLFNSDMIFVLLYATFTIYRIMSLYFCSMIRILNNAHCPGDQDRKPEEVLGQTKMAKMRAGMVKIYYHHLHLHHHQRHHRLDHLHHHRLQATTITITITNHIIIFITRRSGQWAACPGWWRDVAATAALRAAVGTTVPFQGGLEYKKKTVIINQMLKNRNRRRKI